jgi:hypothetical protein
VTDVTSVGNAQHVSAPRLDRLAHVSFFEPTFVILSCLFAAAAYFDAWTYVNNPNGKSILEPWQDAFLHLTWILLTAYLAGVMALNIRRGNPITRSLPPGYGWSMAGCLVFSAMVVIDRWAQLAFGPEYGLSALFSPPRVGEIIAGTLIVTGPLRAAWRRQDTIAGLVAVVSAALLLSTVTFVTQFAHPFRDPLSGGTGPLTGAKLFWVAEDLGAAGLLLQGTALVAVFLLLIRRFTIRPGSFTVILVINGALVAGLKEHWYMILVAAVTGIAADVAYIWLKPGAANLTRLRAFAFLVPAVFAAAYFVAVAISESVWWPAHVWSGAILVTGLGGLLISYLAYTPGGRTVATLPQAAAPPAHWPQISASTVKEALEALPDRVALAQVKLASLPYLGREGGDRAREQDELLRDAARELAGSSDFRDAQSGLLLVDYYVKRNGTHEQIAERLHLSRPAYYRRLQRGCELLAERLESLAAFTETV